MSLLLKLSILVTHLYLLLIGAQVARATQESKLVFSTPQQIEQDFNPIPCKNEERLDAVKALFEKMGAPATDISIEKFKNVENLVVRRKGLIDETVIIGAHYDKAGAGCGAVDNWSGIVTLAHLYRTMLQFKVKKTVLFVAFGKEEKGLVGSRAMAEAIEKEQVPQYCAMINIDSFGLAAPFVLVNISSAKLVELAAELAKQMQIPFAKVRIEGPNSDSSSFKARKIPAVTLSGLSNEWMSVIHTGNDQVKKVKPVSVYLGYRLALAMWSRMERAPCEAFR